MNDKVPPPAEKVLTLPDLWRRAVHRRRGGVPGPAVKIDRAAGAAVDRLVERTGGAVDAMLAGRHGDPGLSAAARRHLAGDPDPAGAAAIAAVMVMANGGPHREAEVHRAFVDHWTSAHGVAFAACALVELSRTSADRAGADLDGDHPEEGVWRGTRIGVHSGGSSGHGPRRAPRGLPAVENLRRVRTLLAAADDDEYADAVERLAGHRDGRRCRWLVSYLVPTRQDWVDECCAEPFDQTAEGLRWLLLHSFGKAEQLATPVGASRLSWGESSRGLLATMVDGLGADVLPFLRRHAERGWLETAGRRQCFEAMSLLPSDEAFRAIADEFGAEPPARPALHAAMKRFPVRAMRLLASANPRTPLRRLHEEHVLANAAMAEAALPELPGEARAAVEEVLASSNRLPDAPPDALPPLLTRPLSEGARRADRPVVTGLETPAIAETHWAEGERERWLAEEFSWVLMPEDPDWETAVKRFRSGDDVGSLQFLLYGPEELVRPLLSFWDASPGWECGPWVRFLAARYGLDVLPGVLTMAKGDPEECGGALAPFLDVEVALLMADWLLQVKKGTGTAARWFERHGLAAVPLLVPAALGKAGERRRSAERGLRQVQVGHGRGEVVRAARAAHGDEAASALDGLLAVHAVESGLVKPVKTGDWATPAGLPQVLLRDRDRALPAPAAQVLIDLLALPATYAMDTTVESLDPDSVARFGWALFQRWREHGTPVKDGWALTQLGRTGNDQTVRDLAPVIRAWPGEAAHKNAVKGLGVLAAVGSDVALMHLHGIARKVRFEGLKGEAEQRIHEVAEGLGLTADQLADRLVPDFGLDGAGSMVLDYGPRRFTVGFDEALRPYVTGEDGRLRKALPKPGPKDDPVAAAAAYKSFAGLRKDVRTIAADRLGRLEAAMTTGRRWSPAEFRTYLVDHPLMRHIARRLLWVSEDAGATVPFRIAEDLTFADAADDPFEPPDTARIGVVHPARLAKDDREAWAETFADYEILQPFPQLARPVFEFTAAERADERLERFENLKVPFGELLALARRGWERGAPQDAGEQQWISLWLAADRHVVIELDPGLSAGAVDARGDHQTLPVVWFATEPGRFRHRPQEDGLRPSFGELDPVTASEILMDLNRLAGKAVAT